MRLATAVPAIVLWAILLCIVLSGCGGPNSDTADGLVSRAATELEDSETTVAGKVVGKDGSPTTETASADAEVGGSSGEANDPTLVSAQPVAVALTPGLTPQDAILEAVTGSVVEVVGGDPCRSLTRQDRVVRCGEAGSLVWEVMSPVDGPGTTVTIYRVIDDSETTSLEPVLQAVDERDRAWDSVGVKAVDLTGDEVPEVVLGFRTTGSGRFLEVDVVANDGQVVLHRSLHHGEALYYLGVYADYAADLGEDEANCCPTVFTRETLSYVGGRWSVSESEPVDADDVLAGLF